MLIEINFIFSIFPYQITVHTMFVTNLGVFQNLSLQKSVKMVKIFKSTEFRIVFKMTTSVYYLNEIMIPKFLYLFCLNHIL